MRKQILSLISISTIIAFLILIHNFAYGFQNKFANHVIKNYENSNGVTAIAEGTISGKQFCAAHTDYYSSLFSAYSQFYPDEYYINIKRYDKNSKKWGTASVEVDEITYSKEKVGDYYKDPNNKKVHFEYE